MNPIVVIDDEPNVVEMYSAILRASGFPVLATTISDEAVRLAIENKASVVLTGFSNCRMTGAEPAQNVLAEHPACEFVFLSGWAEGKEVVESLFPNRFPYLLKPASPEEIRDAVLAAIAVDTEVQ